MRLQIDLIFSLRYESAVDII